MEWCDGAETLAIVSTIVLNNLTKFGIDPTTLKGRTSPEKSIFDEFSRSFKNFRCILACTPIVGLQKSDQSQFSKNSNSKKKIRKILQFFVIQSLCLKVTRKIIQHPWGPLGTCFPSRYTFSSRIFTGASAHLPGDRELLFYRCFNYS